MPSGSVAQSQAFRKQLPALFRSDRYFYLSYFLMNSTTKRLRMNQQAQRLARFPADSDNHFERDARTHVARIARMRHYDKFVAG